MHGHRAPMTYLIQTNQMLHSKDKENHLQPEKRLQTILFDFISKLSYYVNPNQ